MSKTIELALRGLGYAISHEARDVITGCDKHLRLIVPGDVND